MDHGHYCNVKGKHRYCDDGDCAVAQEDAEKGVDRK